MKVITGKVKDATISTVETSEPINLTEEFVNEFFGLVEKKLNDCDFLELFSQNGRIGIEALSRGARYTAYINDEKKESNLIQENLTNIGLDKEASVLVTNLNDGIKELDKEDKIFDIIYINHRKESLEDSIKQLQTARIIFLTTQIVVATKVDTSFEFLEDTNFMIVKEHTDATMKFVFIELK